MLTFYRRGLVHGCIQHLFQSLEGRGAEQRMQSESNKKKLCFDMLVWKQKQLKSFYPSRLTHKARGRVGNAFTHISAGKRNTCLHLLTAPSKACYVINLLLLFQLYFNVSWLVGCSRFVRKPVAWHRKELVKANRDKAASGIYHCYTVVQEHTRILKAEDRVTDKIRKYEWLPSPKEGSQGQHSTKQPEMGFGGWWSNLNQFGN